MATRALQQVLTYLAWDTSALAYKTGDSANHTLSWVKDGTRAAPTNAAAEVDSTNAPGVYKVTMTATETDCIEGILCGKSSTANIVLIPTMVAFDYLNTSAPATAGIPDVALTSAGITAVWAYVITGTTTAVQAMRGFVAALLGKASGLDFNAPVYRNIADTKNVISATTDASGNRTAVTLDLT
jgi:hypothetical protein